MLRSQHFYHIYGPYKVTGRRGETFFVDNIADIFSVSSWRLFELLFSQGASDAQLRMIFDEDLSSDSFQESIERLGTRGDRSVVQLRHLADKMLEGVDGTPSLTYCIGYYRLSHVTIKAFDLVTFRVFCRLLRYAAAGDLVAAKKLFDRTRLELYEDRRTKVRTTVSIRGKRVVRYMATTGERRKNSAHIDEYGEAMVRGARRGIPDSRDDYWRRSPRNWKDSTKNKKQWMKDRR